MDTQRGGATSLAEETVGYALVKSGTTYTASAGDTITKFSMWGKSSGGATGFDLAAYEVSAEVPGNRLGTPVTIVLPTTDPPIAFTDSSAVSQAMIGGTTYGVAIGNDGGATETLYYDAGVADEASIAVAAASLPDPWSEIATGSSKISMYATYTTTPEWYVVIS